MLSETATKYGTEMSGKPWFRALGAAIVALAFAGPALAQSFSAGLELRKAVQERDLGKARKAINDGGQAALGALDQDTGQAALHMAVNRSDALWTQFLLQMGANPDQRDAGNNTPLILAARNGFVDGVRVLLIYRANLEAENESGETALIKAVQTRQVDIIDMLMKRGANADKQDYSGKSAMDYAALDRRSTRILNLLKEGKNGGKPNGSATASTLQP
jgi:uncharacterized protein